MQYRIEKRFTLAYQFTRAGIQSIHRIVSQGAPEGARCDIQLSNEHQISSSDIDEIFADTSIDAYYIKSITISSNYKSDVSCNYSINSDSDLTPSRVTMTGEKSLCLAIESEISNVMSSQASSYWWLYRLPILTGLSVLLGASLLFTVMVPPEFRSEYPNFTSFFTTGFALFCIFQIRSLFFPRVSFAFGRSARGGNPMVAGLKWIIPIVAAAVVTWVVTRWLEGG